jgi:hypothetical protein
LISVKITALLVIMGLIATVGISPSYAYWDKTEYPAIQGTIPVETEEVNSSLAEITLVDAMTIAENEISDSKSMYGKLVSINGYLVYKIVVSNDDHDYKKILVDAGSGEVLYVTDSKNYDSNKKKRYNENRHDKKMKDYFKGMTPEQIAEKKKQFKEMGEAWKSLSIQDKASMIMHFMQMKLQWDMMSEEDKQKQKEEMKEKWKGILTLTPEEKKQKLEEYAQTIKS